MPNLTPETDAERRDNLIEAALRCFARQGYRATTVRDLAAEAGVSTGSIYSRFGSKEGLLEAVAERFEGIRAEAFEVPATDATVPDALVESLAALTDYLDEPRGPDHLRADLVMLAEGLSVPLVRDQILRTDRQHFGAFEALLARAEAWPPGVDPEVLARVVTGSLFGFLVLHAFHDDIDRQRYLACLRALVASAMDAAEPAGRERPHPGESP